jgi:alpha-mannosidase
MANKLSIRGSVSILLSSALAALVASHIAPAQEFGKAYSPSAQTAAALNSLSPDSQQVIERLNKLSDLPVTELKYHVGDDSNAAAPDLDDSSWQTITLPYRASTDVVWLRKWIEVPKALNGYDLTGARITLRGPTRGNEVVYLNGERAAQGEDMEPIVLFNVARSGDRAFLAVKLGKTGNPKLLRRIQLHVDFVPTRPNPEDLRAEFITAALLIPSLGENVTTEKGVLERAMTAVDLKALDESNQEAFDASLRNAKSVLATIEPTLKQITFHLSGNSHIDAAWLWPWTETVDVVRRTFSTAAQLMEEYPTYTYTQSAAQYNVWIADKYPAINDEIKKRIKECRWELVGGMWVEPDLNMPDGESLVRQLLIGKRTFKQLYGVDVKIGWNPDSFGYSWQLPQIYKKAGVDYFVTQKMAWNDTNQLPLKLFWWESPDGSKVLAYFPDGYGNTDLGPVRLANDVVHARKVTPGLTNLLDLYGVGDHGGGPTRAVLDQGLHWMEPDKVVPNLKFGIAQTFFDNVQKKISSDSPVWNYETVAAGKTQLPVPPIGQISIPTWKDELYLEFHRGVFTTQSDHKRNMRDSEEWVLNAEKYSSLAWLDGQPYPAAELTEAWKKVLFNQFHDLAAGSGIGDIYKDAQQDYDQVHLAADEAASEALHTVQASVDTTTTVGSVPVLIFNPLGWQRAGLVQMDVQMPNPTATGVSVLDAGNHLLPSQVLSRNAKTNTYHLLVEARNVPSLGYEVAYVIPGKRAFPTDLEIRGTTLENSRLKVTVDPKTGCITSLYDKKARFETLATGSCGNELIAFKDTPKQFDAWNIDADFDKVFTKLDAAESVQIVEKGPLRAVIRITRSWQNSKFVQDIVLYSGMDEVIVVNDIDWHETHVLLKAAFQLSASDSMATYEIPYGTIQRPTTRNNSWEDAKFEVPALRWADLGNSQHGFSLINESKYGYDAVGNTLRLSLLRSPVSPDPNADRGHHHFSYALYPHAGDWKQAMSVRHGYEFNYGLKAMQVQSHTGILPRNHSFIATAADNIVLTAVKKAEDADALILRFYEWEGTNGNVKIQLPKGVISVRLTNLMEQADQAPLPIENESTVVVPVHPYEIVTLEATYPAPKS